MTGDWRAGFEAGVAQAEREYVPRIAALEGRVAGLIAEVARLRAMLGGPPAQPPATPPTPPAKTSYNSSLPPSSDGPSTPKRRQKHPSGRKRGAQKGHQGHKRELVDPDSTDVKVDIVDCHPRECPSCQAEIPVGQPDVAPAIRSQTWEVPPVKPVVTEYRRHTVECPGCHRLVTAPDTEVPKCTFGPRATAMGAVLHGRWRLSYRETAAVLRVVCGLSVSVGGVTNMCHEASEALAKPYEDIAKQVRGEPVVGVDETSWLQAGEKSWIWVMHGQHATLFLVHPRRNSAALRQLLGPTWEGTVLSDRYKAYLCLQLGKRAVCWAHLKRDFEYFADCSGATGKWGKELLKAEEDVFREWYRFRDGQIDRPALLEALQPTRDKLHELLKEGLKSGVTAGFCREVLALWPALWTFAEREGVEPTNNGSERALRPVVLWRGGCFGAFSDWGNRFVERILSLGATCRQQGTDLLTTVADALAARRAIGPQAHPA